MATEREVLAAFDRGEVSFAAAVELLQVAEPPRWWERPAVIFGLWLFATTPWVFLIVAALALWRWR